MTVQSSGDGRVVSDTQVNRSVLLSQTGLLRLTQFCHALFCIGRINKHFIARFLLESGLPPPLI